MKERRKHQLTAARLEALQNIAIELIRIRDPHEVLSMIVNKAVDLLICDAGSLYLKHNDEKLIFEVSLNRSIQTNFEKRILPVSSSGIANYCYRTGKSVRVQDVYKLQEGAPYAFDRTFDEKTGYRTRSVLVHPLRSSKGESLGVLQLINRKNDIGETWPSANAGRLEQMPDFTNEDDRLLESFAALASASIENATLYQNIAGMFEGFVHAAVDAIEVRDPPTRGHSERVAILTVDLAAKSDRSNDTEIKSLRFNEQQLNEIRYAALLHDFGKIGIREATLLKAEKLSEIEKIRIRSRFDEFTYANEIQSLREFVDTLYKEGRAPNDLEYTRIERHVREFRKKVENYWKLILSLNEPTVLDEDKSHKLEGMRSLTLRNYEGRLRNLLEPDELQVLSIKRGSLSEHERKEIEDHVTLTYHFLKKMPWSKELANVPEIAYAHHEKLDGTGYPRRIQAQMIPIPSRMMAICDIFDALVANDRPYKPSLPIPRALAILEDEAKMGKLDSRLLKVFLDAKVYSNPEFLKLTEIPQKKAA